MPKLNTVSRGLLGGVAGAVAGYGQGLQESGKAKRELFMKQFEMVGKSNLQDKKHRNAMTEINAKGMLANKKPNSIAPYLKEARALATETDQNGIEKFSKPLYIDALNSFGLSDIAKRMSKGDAGSTTFDPTIWETAAARADEETDDKAGFFSTDETDFKNEGRQGFKTRRTIEIFEQLGGRGRPKGQTSKARTASPKATQSVNLDGMETKAAGLKFRALSEGQRFVRGGKTYEKRGDEAFLVKP